MAISVKDIREKEFSRSKSAKYGYDMNEVDDFLDEIAEQLTELIKENIALAEQLENQPEAPAAAPAPAKEEPNYFSELEATLRETLISGKRIAEKTVDDARKEAEEIIENAKKQAEEILVGAKQEVTEAEAAATDIIGDAEKKLEALQTAIADHKAQIKTMIEAQQKLIAE